MEKGSRNVHAGHEAGNLNLSTLTYSTIDLHFHAGFERHPGTGIDDYLEFARMTGRRILGVTDHYNYYFPGMDLGERAYPGTPDGFYRFIADIDEARLRFPGLAILKCPELRAADLAYEIPGKVVRASHFFLCEPPDIRMEQVGPNTESYLEYIRMAAEVRKATLKPVVLVHPFRMAVNLRLIKQPIAPWVTRLEEMPGDNFREEELNRFFMFDIHKYAEACRQEGMPVEINGNTDLRIRQVNLSVPHRMLLAAYKLLAACGVELVPGSDLHGIRTGTGRAGSYVPRETFAALHLSPDGSPFIKKMIALSLDPQI